MKKSIKIQTMPLAAKPSVQRKIDLFYSLKNNFLKNGSGAFGDFFKNISIVLNKASETYSVCGEELPKDQIPRDASMICGPAFISEKYPQPIDSKGSGLFPVLQFDLEWLGLLTGRSFKSVLLQLWWSSNDVRGIIVVIPKSDVALSAALPILLPSDVVEAAKIWVPYDWLCDDDEDAYLVTGCVNVGVTYPRLDDLISDFFDRNVDVDMPDADIDFLEKLRIDSCFSSPVLGKKKVLCNIFGCHKSHSCAPWEVDGDFCFLHTPQWAFGMMDANIFMNIDAKGIVSDFEFGFGR